MTVDTPLYTDGAKVYTTQSAVRAWVHRRRRRVDDRAQAMDAPFYQPSGGDGDSSTQEFQASADD
jgi:hypothetical protein